MLGQPRVIGWIAAAGVHNGRGDVARCRVCVVRRSDVAGGEGIAVGRIFLERRVPGVGLPAGVRPRYFELHVRRIRQQHLVFDNLDLFEAIFAPAIADPLGEDAVARCAGDVRLRGQEGVRGTRAPGRGEEEETVLERSLACGGGGGEAVNGTERYSGNKDTKGTKDTKDQPGGDTP